MKMGEVVDEAKTKSTIAIATSCNSSQQNVEVTSSGPSLLVDDDEDEEDGSDQQLLVRVAKKYAKVARFRLIYDGYRVTDCAQPPEIKCAEPKTNPDSDSTLSNGDWSTICPFRVLLPTAVERKRKKIRKRYFQLLKRSSARKPLHEILKSHKTHQLKYLEGAYIRNIHYQSIPTCSAAESWLLKNVPQSGPSKVANHVNDGSSKSGCNSSVSSEKPLVQDRTLLNDSHTGGAPVIVPKCSVISDKKPYGGSWLQCLKSKGMNARKPTHLVQAAYDHSHLSKKKWLSSQPKRQRRRSPSSSSVPNITGTIENNAPSVVPEVSSKLDDTASPLRSNSDDKKSSSTTNLPVGVNSGVTLSPSKPGVTNESSQSTDTLSMAPLPSSALQASKSQEKSPTLPTDDSSLKNSAEQMQSETVESEVCSDQLGAIAGSKDDQRDHPPVNVTNAPVSTVSSPSVTDRTYGLSSVSTQVVVAISKEELDQGRKPSGSSLLSQVVNNGKRAGSVGSDDSSKTVSSATSLSNPTLSSNVSEISKKSVISQSSDTSSASTSCSSGSSSTNSSSEGVTLIASNGTQSLPAPFTGATLVSTSTSLTSTNNSSNSVSAGGQNSNASGNQSTSNGGRGESGATSSNPVPSNLNAKSNKKLGSGSGGGGNGGSGPKAPRKYSEKMIAEASVVQRISELQKEGMWSEKRLPKVWEPQRHKSHWDYMMEEMVWLASDFVNERKWKRNAAKKCARMIEKYFHDKELKRQKAEKEKEVRRKQCAANIAKLVKQFWKNVQTVVEFKEQTMIESLKKQALDQKLSYLVNETEKYSEIVAQRFSTIAQKNGIDIEESRTGSDTGSDMIVSVKEEVPSPAIAPPTEDADGEFVPPSDSESDVDDTIAEEEAKEKSELPDYKNELDDLEAENNMSYEELLAKYSTYIDDPEAFQEPSEKDGPTEPEVKPRAELQETPRRMTRGSIMASDRQLRTTPGRRSIEPPKVAESDIETDVDDESGSSSSEEDSQYEEMDEDASDQDKTNDDLASLLKSISTNDGNNGDGNKRTTEEETNKLADLAESFKPKGYTLSSTTVVTKVPHLLRHSLREYQHIGLDWLVAMYDKKLNGILADEMGLGKTIQTIALLAYLAVERCNWGPHLIIVPTSVMLNWEMEFKKWCPGFKILTYYGSQKERKLKRSGWTKANAFHVCITSYKLVIQDHQSFRRKRWKYLILDEAQNIKNFKSQRWQLLLNFHTQRRLLLTGTPLQNNLMELWSLLHFLMPNVFQSHMEFKDWFSNPMSGMVEGSQEYNEDIVRRLHKVLRPFILRRMKSQVEKQLPQKYEHVIMCSLSKRQRYLYEEFMSRSKTRETLSQGNLLSVINILMQLRKVCNHPNLFEPRPIVSPLQTEGITYSVPAGVWDVLSAISEDSFRTSFPLFTISNPAFSYPEYEAMRIDELTPLFTYNHDMKSRYVVMNYENIVDASQPPAKRVKRIVNLVKTEPPPCPRLSRPLTFFMAQGSSQQFLQDGEFVDCLKRDATQKQTVSIASKEGTEKDSTNAPVKPSASTTSSGIVVLDGSGEGTPGGMPSTVALRPTIVLSDSDNDEKSSSDSDFEAVTVRRRKVPVPTFNIETRLKMMGYSVPQLLLNEIQERRLVDRKTVVNNLNKVNWARCRVHTLANSKLVATCRVVGALPPIRLTSRKTGWRGIRLNVDKPRDYKNCGYFHQGHNEIARLVETRLEAPNLLNHPLLMWKTTHTLSNLIRTPSNRLDELKNILDRYIMYIPAVTAPALDKKVYKPASSNKYINYLNRLDDFRKTFNKSTDIIHPIVSRMNTHFPDPRLIQYDCGKLQTLDELLRRLKSKSHRVLIFTQMAKVLDILEAFLNYHGHTYLRLDGATKIDQRQLLMERFNADKKIFCFILSTRSGGIGVNLTGADTVIFYDSDWNPTMDAQAQDRCHRIGQTRDVHIYRLVSEKTVEENILKKSNQKRLLGELAIEGGRFNTTFFKQNTIRELFSINEKDEVAKRLNTWNLGSDNSSLSALNKPDTSSFASTAQKEPKTSTEEEDDSTFDPSDLMRSPEKKHEMQMIECALAAAEDETDIQAAQTVHAEAAAEMAEFDENVSLDTLDDGKSGPNKFDLEFQQVYDKLLSVEQYAIRLMEATIDDWSKETVAQAQKDLEEQKIAWELQQQQKLAQDPSLNSNRLETEDDACATEDLLTYSRIDNLNQDVWVAQMGTFEQEMLFPIYEPPTPPVSDMDVYFDETHGYLYRYDIMTENELPPVYIPKHPKKSEKSPAHSALTVSKPAPSGVVNTGVEKTPEVVSNDVTPVKDGSESMDLGDADTSPQKKSPKVGRREDPIFAPKSLFDKPSPQLAKIRRDLRLQRYSNRPASNSIKTLGPGSITFPIVNATTQKTPPPPAPLDAPDWMLAEDNSLLNTVKNVHELPINLMVINAGQTPNWDFAHETVNSVGLTHRTAKQCKWRFDQVVGPREEGKIVLEGPSSNTNSSTDPASPSSVGTGTGKKKKTKAPPSFIKINPPSPSKANRPMKLSQMMIMDNNSQYGDLFIKKFDTIKAIANKRAPTTKPVTVASQVKTRDKQIQSVTEMGVNYDVPLSAMAIAQARYDRMQQERKKLELQRQQQEALQVKATVQTAQKVPALSVPKQDSVPYVTKYITDPRTAGIQRTVEFAQVQQVATYTSGQMIAAGHVPAPAGATVVAGTSGSVPASPSGTQTTIKATELSALLNTRSGPVTSVTLPQGIIPVLASNSPEVNVHRDVNIPNIIAQQRNARQQQHQQQLQEAIFNPHQQQLLHFAQACQKPPLIQTNHQHISNLLNQHTQMQQQQATGVSVAQQQSVNALSSQTSNVTVLKSDGTTTSGTITTNQVGAIVRPTVSAPTSIQVHQGNVAPQQTQTVMLTPGLAQALAASVGQQISVSSPSISSMNSNTLSAPPASSATTSPQTHHLQSAISSSQQQLSRVPTITMQDLVSPTVVTSQQRLQTGIITTSVSTVPSGPTVVSSQSQPTLVSLTPIRGANNQSLATAKFVQNAQGIATLVQSTQARPGTSPHQISTQTPVNRLTPVQLQYLKNAGAIRQPSPVVSTVPLTQQQQVQQIKENLMSSSAQIKRIQVVTASPSPPIAGVSTPSISAQPPQSTVTLPSVSTITGAGAPKFTMLSPADGTVVGTTAVVNIISNSSTSKVSLTQPSVTMAINSPSMSPSIINSQQRSVQLVKQHTVGGKTITRPVTDAEVQAFLKLHGIPGIPNAVSPTPQGKSPTVATFQGSVPGSPTLLTVGVGLQNLMKVQPNNPGQVATLVKTNLGQATQSAVQGQTIFPVHLGKVSAKGTPSVSPTAATAKQQTLPNIGQALQHQLLMKRQSDMFGQSIQQQQVSQAPQTSTTAPGTPVSTAPGGKLGHITTPVTHQGAMPTHVVVQTMQNKLPNTIAVQQFQQVFKQVGPTGQVITTGQGGQVLQAQMLGNPVAVSGSPNTITVTTSGGVVTSQPTMPVPQSVPPSSTGGAPKFVHVSNISNLGSGLHARLLPVNVNLASQPPGAVKQTIQVVSGPPSANATLIGTSPMNLRPPQPPVVSGANVQPVNSIQIKMPVSSSSVPPSNPEEKS